MVGSIIISLFTIKVGLSLFLSNVRSVIGEIDLDPIKINIIKETIFENKKIIDIKDITLLKFGSYINLIVEIVLNKNTKLKKINIIESLIKKNIKEKCESIKYITISVSHNK